MFGPHPLSCITCRERLVLNFRSPTINEHGVRRRKKCDRTHPTCNRCKAGGFTCRGYVVRDQLTDDESRLAIVSQWSQPSVPSQGLPFYYDPTPLPTTDGVYLSSEHAGPSTWHSRFQNDTSSSTRASDLLVQQPGNAVCTNYLSEGLAPQQNVKEAFCSLPEDIDSFPLDTQAQHFPNRLEPNTGILRRSSKVRRRASDSNAHRVSDTGPSLWIYPDIDSSVVVVEFITSQCKSPIRFTRLISDSALFR